MNKSPIGLNVKNAVYEGDPRVDAKAGDEPYCCFERKINDLWSSYLQMEVLEVQQGDQEKRVKLQIS